MNTKFQFFVILFVIVLLCCSFGVRAEEIRWLQAGRLHNWFSAAGCEIEVGRRHLTSDQQDGFRYPADKGAQDMQCAKGLWIGAKNFNDPIAGQLYSYKVVHVGPRIMKPETEFMPVSMKLIRKQAAPKVYVDGKIASSLYDQADEIDETLPSDEMIHNVVNTSIGITVTRDIYSYTNPDQENYLIYDFTFENTGIYDKDGHIQSQTLEDVIFFFQYRWAICKYIGAYGLHYAPHDATWGVNTVNEVLHPEYGDAIRATYAWHGLHSGYGVDNVGAPYIGSGGTGFLGASQFPGVVTIHADKSATDKSDDPDQPKTQIPIYSDAHITQTSFNDQFIESNMEVEYTEYMNAGLTPETHADMVGDGFANELPLAGGGGVSQGVGYGPYTLASGQSIHIVMAEAAGSIDWQKRESIGRKWLNEISPYTLPDGSTTADRNEFKNRWVFTGVDSMLQAFERAKTVWENNFIADPVPPAPATFEVTSQSDRVELVWDNSAESYTHFAGYRLYRADGGPDSTFQLIFECGQGTANQLTNQYEDHAVIPGEEYYYYLTAYDDGTVNSMKPGVSLESSRFKTLTANPASLRDADVITADVFVSPDGNDANDGLTVETPFKSIGFALSRIAGSGLEERTVHLSEGIYSPQTTGDVFPLSGKHYITIEGAGSNATMIDADTSATVFRVSGSQGFHLINLALVNGKGDQGGGIYVGNDATIRLSGVKITGNKANLGGGIYFSDNAVIEFDSLNRCDIYNNDATAGYAADLYSASLIPRKVFADSFTVKNPCHYLAYPANMFQLDVQTGIIPQVSGDIYVSPDGNDTNDGNSVSNPLKTIRQAIIKMNASETNPGTIHLADGVYSPFTTDEDFPILVRSYLNISGSSTKSTILDAEMTSGVFFFEYGQDISLNDFSIVNGFAPAGGGVYLGAHVTSVTIQNVLVKYCRALLGGGLYLSPLSLDINLLNVSVTNNQATDKGGGLYIGSPDVIFDQNQRCSVYENAASEPGYDLFAWGNWSFDPVAVYLDTFSVSYPIEKYASPVESFVFDINNSVIPQAEADLYVSPGGSNENDGLSFQAPMQTISAALEYIFADQERPHTIYLDEGVYSSSTNGEEFPIILRDYITLKGQGDSLTILDGEDEHRIIECSGLESVNLKDISLIRGFNDDGAGIYCDQSSMVLENVWIRECKGSNGAGLYLKNNSFVQMKFTSITDDSAKYGSAIACGGSYLKIHNSTFVNNGYYIGGIYSAAGYENESEILIVNSIFWENGKYQIAAIGNYPIVTIGSSDISGGESDIKHVTLNWLEGNIDSDPLFVGGDPFNYHLSASSPCREAGTNLLVVEGDTLFYLPDSCYTGAVPDIGRWGVDPALSVNPEERLPEKFVLHPNYPNPFNPSTMISYEIPKESQVTLLIFDITGRLVRHLTHTRQQPGYYCLIWDGKNDYGYDVPSGQYFLLMKTDSFRKTEKMVLLK